MLEILKYVSEEDRSIYEKWYNLGLIPEDENIINNIFLAKIYEKSNDFILNLADKQPTWWGECNFTKLFIPLIKRLYIEKLTDNYELVYRKFEEWYNSKGKQYTTDFDIIINFLEYFKEFKEDNVKDDVKKYCIINDETAGIVKSEYKKEILIKNLEFEKCSEDEKEAILNELSRILNNHNFNVCYCPIYKVNGEFYSVGETNDTINDLVNHIDNGYTISVFSAKFNNNGILVYRYNVNNK